MVGRKEKRKKAVVDHIVEGNGEGRRDPFSHDVWYVIPPIISTIQERSKFWGALKDLESLP